VPGTARGDGAVDDSLTTPRSAALSFDIRRRSFCLLVTGGYRIIAPKKLTALLDQHSYVQCEQIRTVFAERMIRPLANVSDLTLMHIEQILRRILML
jgi:mRNA-degrading endonuclease toxin of MazEF toxin-antitoxin module